MVYSAAELLKLQANIKRDPDGYKDEFLLQHRHYRALLSIAALNPGGPEGRALGDALTFVTQVSKVYPDATSGLADELMGLLGGAAAAAGGAAGGVGGVGGAGGSSGPAGSAPAAAAAAAAAAAGGSGPAGLDPALRRSAVAALILLRNRNQLDPLVLLPLLFRLFNVPDKSLREMCFRHIVSDLKAANARGRNERLNRGVQGLLYEAVTGEPAGGAAAAAAAAAAGGGGASSSISSDASAKQALAVLTELWRRRIWRDARTVNCIAAAVFHRSPRVSGAALKFFLGQEAAAAAGDDSDSDDDDAPGGGGPSKGGAHSSSRTPLAAPTKEEVYKAMHKGTKSSKRKKQAKLKRVMSSLKKAARREAGAGAGTGEGFAALHLLHDPQGFAERLFSRLQGARERWEARLDMMTVVARVVGLHRLLLLNLYPFLQKYVAPSQRDVTRVIAALVSGSHDLVPPDALAPALRQLVDQFVHDRARPEVMTVGLKAVRELALRCPLVMSPELLQDLAEYRRFRNKEVASAARALVAAYREINPSLLAKRDRGRAADLAAAPASYGSLAAAARLDGAELLEAELAAAAAAGRLGSDGDFGSGDAGYDDDGGALSDDEVDRLLGLRGSSSSDEDDSSDEDGSSSGDDDGEGGSSSGGEDEEEGDEAGSSGEGEDGEQQQLQEQQQRPRGSKAAAAAAAAAGSDDDAGGSSEAGSSEDGEEGLSGSGGDGGSSSGGEDEEEAAEGSDDAADEGAAAAAAAAGKKQPQQASQPGSLSSLKKQLAARRQQQQQQQQSEAGPEPPSGLPLEMTRIFGEEDFARMRQLKRRALIKAALSRHGLAASKAGDQKKKQQPMSEAKRKRLLAAAEAEADEALALAGKRARLGEAGVDPGDLMGRHKGRADKAERLASVMAGREGRPEFGAKAKLKQKKTGSLSERQKQRQKAMPIAARLAQLKNRSLKARNRSNPRHFKGHVRSKQK